MKKNDQGHIGVHFLDKGREPQCPPNPQFPNGQEIDASLGAYVTCTVDLPYPAKRCGLWQVTCSTCGLSVTLTAAGRPDDPKSVKLGCRRIGATGNFPHGKLNREDEGELTLAVSVAFATTVLKYAHQIVSAK
jgi:hypothetical protein